MDNEISRLQAYNSELLETLEQVLNDHIELREKYDQYVRIFDELQGEL